MAFFKENNNVLIVLDSDISNDDIVDFISAIQKRLNHAEQLSIVSTKELKKCKYINIFKCLFQFYVIAIFSLCFFVFFQVLILLYMI